MGVHKEITVNVEGLEIADVMFLGLK